MRRFALLALFAAAGCSEGPSDKAFRDGAASLVRGAKTVQAHRIDVPERLPNKPFEYDWWKWPVKGDAVPVDATTAARLATILLDDKSYHTGAPKACIPQPGVKYSFAEGTRSVTVLVCYECRQFFTKNSWGGGGGGDFDPAAPELEEIAKQLFPKDGEIQSFTGLATPPKAAPWKDLAAGLATTTSVEAWLIAGDFKKAATYFDYKEIAGPVMLGKPAAADLVATLSDPKLVKPGARPCEPSPGVKLRFNRPGPHPVWVFLCFECNELFVYEGKAERDGGILDDARPKLLSLLKPLFPKDASFQSLK